ncbi:hypothetical protein Sm713_73520 [Streptomyces sp. TS71-3]|nr:hypothetical protein Sm713_73520 [Streptomyces sp. TS71-3]
MGLTSAAGSWTGVAAAAADALPAACSGSAARPRTEMRTKRLRNRLLRGGALERRRLTIRCLRASCLAQGVRG